MNRTKARGFTLIELLVVMAIIALLVGMILPALAQVRNAAMLAQAQSNLRQMAIAAESYSTDQSELIVSLTGLPGTDFDDPGTRDWEESRLHAKDIIERWTGRTLSDTLPYRYMNRHFTQLALVDGGYYGGRIPEESLASPADKDLIEWQRNPSSVSFTPRAAGFEEYVPYMSTWQIVPVTWTLDTREGNQYPSYQVRSNHREYVFGQHKLRARAEVSFPSQKVLFFDLFDRYYQPRGQRMFHAFPQAQQPLGFFDGSVTSRRTGDANPGFQPLAPTSNDPTTYIYDSTFWGGYEPRSPSGREKEEVIGYYRWTRGGLKGIDFGGSEVDTGQLIRRRRSR